MKDRQLPWTAPKPAYLLPGEACTDCNTPEGITVGLIDALMSIARVLKPRLQAASEKYEGYSYVPLQEAMKDLQQDSDVLFIVGENFSEALNKTYEEWKAAVAQPEAPKERP